MAFAHPCSQTNLLYTEVGDVLLLESESQQDITLADGHFVRSSAKRERDWKACVVDWNNGLRLVVLADDD